MPGPQEIYYTSFNKVSAINDSIDKKLFRLEIAYGPDQQRVKNIFSENGTTTKTKYYAPGYEKEVTSSGTRELYYLNCPYGLVAINIRKNGADSTYYTDTDHLGSILALLRNNGSQTAEYSYDEWGRRRQPSNWTLYDNIPSLGFIDRGYTGHEHYDQFGLIDMNGRVYDPIIGRFLSPDPIIQAPDFTQNYNGYSYCFNNPLKYIDLSGYSAYNSYYSYIEAQYQGYEGTYTEYSNQYFSYYQNERSFSYFGGGGGAGGSGRSGTKTYTYTWQERVYPPLTPGNVAVWDPVTQSFIIPPVGISPPQYVTHSTTVTVDDPSQDGLPSWLSWTNNGINAAGYGGYEVGGTFRLMKSGSLSLGWYKSGWRTGNQYVKTTYSLSKLGTGIGIGTSALGAVMGLYNFSVSDKSWGDYGQCGVSLLSAGLTCFPATTPVGIGLGVADLSGGFNGFYNYLDANQQFYNSTGSIMIPGNMGVPMLIKLK